MTHPTITPGPAANAAPHDGEKLKHYLKDLEVSIDAFATDYLDKSKPVAYALLRKERFTRDEAALICYIFALPPGFFAGQEDARPLRTEYNTKMLEVGSQLADFIAFTAYESAERSPRIFVRDYFERLRHYIGLAQHKLRIYRYFGKLYGEFPDYVREQYRPLYEACEQQMHVNPTLQYERFCALPFLKNTGVDAVAPSFEDTVQDLLAEMLPETVGHIVYCLRNFPDRFRLYAIRIPMRLHSFTLVDQQYALSEYDRIDRHGKVTHDMLFVDRAGNGSANDDPIRRLVDVYHQDLNNLARETGRGEQRVVTLELMLEAVADAIATRRTAVINLKQEYEESIQELNNWVAQQDSAVDKGRRQLGDLRLRITLAEKDLEVWVSKKDIIQGKEANMLN